MANKQFCLLLAVLLTSCHPDSEFKDMFNIDGESALFMGLSLFLLILLFSSNSF